MNREAGPVGSGLLWAQTLLERHRASDALAVVQDVRRDDPSNVAAMCLEANCHLALERWGRAADCARQALARDPGSAFAHRLAALADVRQYDGGTRALNHARKAIELEPREPAGFATLASVLLTEGDLRGARWALDRGFELSPGNPGLHGIAGRVELAALRLSRARRHFRAQLAAEPTNWAAHNNLGTIAFRRGNVLSASNHYLRSIRLHPDQVPIDNLRGTVTASSGFLLSVLTLGFGLVGATARQPAWLPVVLLPMLAGLTVALAWAGLRRLPRATRTLAREAVGESLTMVGLAAVIASPLKGGSLQDRPHRVRFAAFLGAATAACGIGGGMIPGTQGAALATFAVGLCVPVVFLMPLGVLLGNHRP